uniref:Sirohydrochlorin cobaltochelatase n=1 Tax=Pinguiococcus pyrenoidosus TaxID=172671 RepID=A0A6U0WSQ7_9STRA|mmetsp:Transcript_9218/g.34631  ORF Transcript_9218/g.34631 Transcript_9218/m.34631 type:complete len:168 (+) Transcript_9218:127-630(+)
MPSKATIALLFGLASAFHAPRQPRRASGALRADRVGYIIVDHGSRRDTANAVVGELAAQLRERLQTENVQPAHMELAEPSIQTAFDKCVESGATHVICHPFFLTPGRHVLEDVPALVEEAAERYKSRGISYEITSPLGALPQIVDLIEESVTTAAESAVPAAQEVAK